MKLKLTTSNHLLLLFIASPSILLLLLLSLASPGSANAATGNYLLRLKRQVTRGPRPNINNQVDSAEAGPPMNQAANALAMGVASMNSQPGAMSMATAMDPPPVSSAAQAGGSNFAPMNRQPRPPPAEEPEEPERRRPARRRRPNRRPPPASRDRYESGNQRGRDDCDDDEYDYDYDYQDMMMRPMRQMGRMMNNVFNQMQSTMKYAGGAPEYDSGEGNRASASAFSSANGDSRLSSFVSTGNGRSRGVVSETRDGRTQTRRFGSQPDEEEEEDS